MGESNSKVAVIEGQKQVKQKELEKPRAVEKCKPWVRDEEEEQRERERKLKLREEEVARREQDLEKKKKGNGSAERGAMKARKYDRSS